MSPEDRDKALERMADLALLTAETILDHVAMVVSGEKRIAFVPRQLHASIGQVWELRLTTPPPVDKGKREPPREQPPMSEVLPAECGTCEGTGKVAGPDGPMGDLMTCPVCHGLGRVVSTGLDIV